MSNNRYYSLEFIIYARPANIRKYVESLKPSPFTHWLISPYHDSDLNDDGQPVKPHSHFFARLISQKSFSSASRIFADFDDCTVLPENVCPIFGTYSNRYLYSFHGDPESIAAKKHRYDESDVLCDSLSAWKDDDSSNDSSRALQMFNDYEDGMLFRDMLAKYGNYFLQNFYRLKELADAISYQEQYITALQNSEREHSDIVHIVEPLKSRDGRIVGYSLEALPPEIDYVTAHPFDPDSASGSEILKKHKKNRKKS